MALEHVAYGEDRAAEVAEDDDAVALVGGSNGRAHPVLVGSRLPVGETAGGLDAHLGTGDLRGEDRETLRKLRAMRYDYDPDHAHTLIYTIEVDSTIPNRKRSPKRGTIQSVDRAARILKALAAGPRRLGVSELADRLDMSRPTVHGLLQTLLAHGFVEQDRDSDKYQLGAGLLQLGNSYLDLNELRGRSIVHAERLAERTDAAVRVGVMHGARVVVVHHVFRPDTTLQILEVGAELPVHASALGKSILAFAPGSSLEDLLAEPPPSSPAARSHPRASQGADGVRESGIARERDEAVLGESSVAAPSSTTRATPSEHRRGGRHGAHPPPRARARISGAVVEAARGVSRELGARRWPAPPIG